MSMPARAFGAQSFHRARPRTEATGLDRWYLEEAKRRLAQDKVASPEDLALGRIDGAKEP